MQQKPITELLKNDKIIVPSGNNYHEVIVSHVDVFTSPDHRTYYYLYGTYAGTSMQYIQSIFTENNEIPNVLYAEHMQPNGIVMNDTAQTVPETVSGSISKPAKEPTQPAAKTAKTKRSTSAKSAKSSKAKQQPEPPSFIKELEEEYYTQKIKQFEKPVTFTLRGNTTYFQSNIYEANLMLHTGKTNLSKFSMEQSRNHLHDYERVVLWKKSELRNPVALGFVPDEITEKLQDYDYTYDIQDVNIDCNPKNNTYLARLTVKFNIAA